MVIDVCCWGAVCSISDLVMIFSRGVPKSQQAMLISSLLRYPDDCTSNSLLLLLILLLLIHWKVWGVRPKWGEKNPFKNMRKNGKLGKIMEDNEKIWQHDKGHKNMTIWEFDSLRELWLKLLSQCAWMVSSTSLQCQGLRFVQSLWADPSHVILKGESGQQWSPVSCRSKHLQMNELEMAWSHRGQGRAGSRPSNIFKYLQMN